jgi:hypothetical protein
VTEFVRTWSTAVELRVVVEGTGQEVAGLAYTDVVGAIELGDEVLLNVTALDLDLGTGGYALVAAVPGRLPPDPGGPGHLVKARYTPLQMTVLGVDEQESPHHAAFDESAELGGMPVVIADLHSALPAVIAGIRDEFPSARVAYVATEGGALPLAFSRTVDALRSAGWLCGSVTCGQTFGGDLEAVTVHNGLIAAHAVLEADIAVVTQGPGNLGTGTRWGFSGVAAGEAVNAVSVLGGRPVAALRVSEADQRERHYGVSHHSMTAYGYVALRPADVPVPDLAGDLGAQVRRQAATLSPPHRIVDVDTQGLDEALSSTPVKLSTMGRGLASDRAAFIASAAAGRHSASLGKEQLIDPTD